ncbi:unnamed protein product [Caenorhabditis sp. 36 PRJEB53466]|nr:unnamed protein product [Caenorhabditis sp. 36 PRJEB53466]
MSSPMRELPNPNESAHFETIDFSDFPLHQIQKLIEEKVANQHELAIHAKERRTIEYERERIATERGLHAEAKRWLMQEVSERDNKVQRNPNSFSYLLEEEATRFAQDIDMLYKAYFPSDSIGREMIEKMLASGKTPDAIEIFLQNGVTAMPGLVKTLESRQPAIVYKERRVKRNSLDSDYEQVSALTHGFAHPTSITNYRFMQAAFGRALSAIQAVKQGRALAKNCSIDPLAEKPFKYMTDAAYEEWKNVMNGHPSEPKFTNPVLWGGEPPV